MNLGQQPVFVDMNGQVPYVQHPPMILDQSYPFQTMQPVQPQHLLVSASPPDIVSKIPFQKISATLPSEPSSNTGTHVATAFTLVPSVVSHPNIPTFPTPVPYPTIPTSVPYPTIPAIHAPVQESVAYPVLHQYSPLPPPPSYHYSPPPHHYHDRLSLPPYVAFFIRSNINF